MTVDTQKVMMVIPPSLFLLDERVFVSLGILKVASVLEKSGHIVEVIDLSGVENFEEVIEIAVKNSSPDVVAVTSTTPQLPAVIKIANRIKRHDMKLILGGPHVTMSYAAHKKELKLGVIGRATKSIEKLTNVFDVIVSGDGETSILKAINRNCDKIIDADDIKNGMFMSNSVYEDMPLPARHLIDMSSYKYSIDGHNSTSLISQLGCPYGCSFCGGRNTNSFRRIRTRSVESVIKEIKELHENHGYTGFMFYDDELNVNKNMVTLMNKITELQTELGVEFRLRGFIKSELFNEEQARSMYSAGFRWLLCGFESANDRILKNINKKATVYDNNKVMEISKKHGLKIKALMSIGHAGESEKTVMDTNNWLVSNKPDDFDCTIISCYPGTSYFDDAILSISGDFWTYTDKNSGDKLHSYDIDYNTISDYYKGDPDGGYTSYVFTDYLNREEMVTMRDYVEKNVREKLSIPFNVGNKSAKYEHSMGQTALPRSIKYTNS